MLVRLIGLQGVCDCAVLAIKEVGGRGEKVGEQTGRKSPSIPLNFDFKE